MFQVTGRLDNLFETKANEKYEASFKAQVTGRHLLQDGQVKMEMITLAVPQELYARLHAKLGEEITLPVGMFVKGNNLNVYFPKGGRADLGGFPA